MRDCWGSNPFAPSGHNTTVAKSPSLIVAFMEDSRFAVTFGFRMNRGGLRITGSHIVHAPNSRLAWQRAKSMCARHEQVLYVDHIKDDQVVT